MKRKQSGYQNQYVDPDELFTEDDDYHEPVAHKKSKGTKNKSGGAHHQEKADKRAGAGLDQNGRTRPTNNQLLYKAYFRWPHYPCYFKPGTAMPIETDACASVTSAFLQVLHTLHAAEQLRSAGTQHQRSVLQILSTNTRRTKVVELSSGTHRVPEELKKHYLADGEGGQYSTNLDRNRYGNDDNYLFTVIRYDLEFLGLCPCMVDVEIIDAKAGNQSVIVSAGPDACTCQHKPEIINYGEQPPAPGVHMPHQPVQQQLPAQQPYQPLPQQPPPQLPPVKPLPAKQPVAKPAALAPLRELPPPVEPPPLPQPVPRTGRGTNAILPTSSRDSPKPSGSGVSQLFDALVMAATGGQDGAAMPMEGLGGEAPVTSAYLNALPGGTGGEGQDMGNGGRLPGRGPQLHHAPMRNKSRLWSAMSFGDMDSLQNALDAFRAEEEIASQPFNQISAEATNGGDNVLRQRRRKPPRGNSSFLLRAGDSSLAADISLGKLGIKFDSEKSGDNQGYDDNVDGPSTAAPADSQDDEHAEGGGGTTGDGTDELPGEEGAERHRQRHVPRQASAVNLSNRMPHAEVKRLQAELEDLRDENRRLKEQQQQHDSDRKGDGDDRRVRALEAELESVRSDAAAQAAARKAAEERLDAVNMELSKVLHENQALAAKLMAAGALAAPQLMGAHAHMAQLAAVAAAGGPSAGALMGGPVLDPALASLAASYPTGWRPY